MLSKLSVMLMDEQFTNSLINAGSVDEFLNIIDSAETVIDLGVRYSRIIFLFTIAIMANLYFEKVFQAVGRMKAVSYTHLSDR